MSNTPRVTTASTDAPAPAASRPGRQRLRSVDRDEVVRVTDFLPPGATWLPVPQHTLPELPGRPPMVGYLVLVPADRTTGGADLAAALAAVPAPASAPAPGARPTPAPVPSPAPAPDPASEHPTPEHPAGDGPVRIDAERRLALVAGRPLDLTYLEFELLTHLVSRPNRVHSRDQLVNSVWGYGHVGDGRTVDVHIARLRRKLGVEHRGTIRTIRRVGYAYTPLAL